jgi:lipopolysaccharide transport system ATP-binding protein
MKDVSGKEGRTVLFVSHNMAAVETLCTQALLMQNGKIFQKGTPAQMIKVYLENSVFLNNVYKSNNIEESIGNDNIRVLFAAVENGSSINTTEIIDVKSEINFRIVIINKTKEDIISVGFDLLSMKGDIIFGSAHKFNCQVNEPVEIMCEIPANFLNTDLYQVHLYFHTKDMTGLFSIKEFLTFEIKDVERENGYLGKVNGFVRPVLNWKKINELNKVF